MDLLDWKRAEQTSNWNQFICFIAFININYQTSEKEKSNPRIWTNYQEGKNNKIENNLDAHTDGNWKNRGP
jgi:hypothetical protein